MVDLRSNKDLDEFRELKERAARLEEENAVLAARVKEHEEAADPEKMGLRSLYAASNVAEIRQANLRAHRQNQLADPAARRSAVFYGEGARERIARAEREGRQPDQTDLHAVADGELAQEIENGMNPPSAA